MERCLIKQIIRNILLCSRNRSIKTKEWKKFFGFHVGDVLSPGLLGCGAVSEVHAASIFTVKWRQQELRAYNVPYLFESTLRSQEPAKKFFATS
jgi:hypothetical protein